MEVDRIILDLHVIMVEDAIRMLEVYPIHALIDSAVVYTRLFTGG